jgi:ParB/RepB/Spo0J family partition protein
MRVSLNIQSIGLEKIDTGLSDLRLTSSYWISYMAGLLEKSGQLQPIILRKLPVKQKGKEYQLIDGFKRYHAAIKLKWGQLQARVIDVPDTIAKAMIISYNKCSRSLVAYEEGLVVHSLKKDHLLDGHQIAKLLGYSPSWVCRRLALVERMSPAVQSALRMGQLTEGHARSLIKLPHGNQMQFTESIIAHNLTTGQTGRLIEKYLQSKTKDELKWLLTHPVEAINTVDKETYDCRLTPHGNRLLKTIEILNNQQHIFIGQYTSGTAQGLSATETDILRPRLAHLLRRCTNIIKILTKK